LDLTGVVSVTSGYIGGHVKDPTYEQVCTGETGHTEAVEILFDPAQISYTKLLDVFWQNIDPTTIDKQFVDEGSQYRTGIFYHSEKQRQLAEGSKEKLESEDRFGAPIVTEITPATQFYPAEKYHQGYCRLRPMHYAMYRAGSGRDEYLDQVWGKDRDKGTH
jgi:methionine-S-sulfoxide reductase